MDTKLLDNSEIMPAVPDQEKDGKAGQEDDPFSWLGGRTVPLPKGMTLNELRKLSSAEIDAKIKEEGSGIGYAAMIALAAGKGNTPPGTQYHAAKFLLDRGAELERDEAADRDIGSRLRALPREQLLELIHHYEQKALESALNSQKPIDIDACS